MTNRIFKSIFILTSLSPILLIVYIINVITNWGFKKPQSFPEIIGIFIKEYYFILPSLILIFICVKMVEYANKIIDISNFSREASDEEIKNFFNSKQISFQSTTDIISKNDSVSRKKIGFIIDEKILKNISPKKIRSVCKEYGLIVKIETNKVVAPNNKKDLLSC